MRDVDSYLAGVFDGEGYVTAHAKPGYTKSVSSRVYTRLLVGVGMTGRPVLEQFLQRFGGSLKEYRQPSGRPIYQWYRSGGHTVEVLEVFSELCIEKREQARLGLVLAKLLVVGRANHKRIRGYKIVSDDEMTERIALCENITALKRPWLYADA